MNFINNFKLRYLGYIPLFFAFLPAFAIPFGKKPITIFFISITAFFIIYFFFNFKAFIKNLIILYKKTPFKKIAYWIIWVILSGLLLVILGKYTIVHYIYYIILFLGINMILPLLLPTVMCKNAYDFRKFMKFIYVAIYVVLLLGIINYISFAFSIGFIQDFFNIIVNIHNFGGYSNAAVLSYGSKVKAFSVFSEPGYFGGFIALTLPILFSITKSKYKIFANSYLSFIYKSTVIPIALLDVIFTKSPIWLIVCFSLYFFLLSSHFFTKLYKNKIKFLIFVIIAGFVIYAGVQLLFLYAGNESSDVKYLSRITDTVEAVKQRDFVLFINVEPSLATRVCSYINSLRIFLNYPITGIGLGNSKFYMADMYQSSPVPLAVENQVNLIISGTTNNVKFNAALLYELLSETGIIGFLLYFSFPVALYIELNKKAKKQFNSFNHLETGLKRSLLVILFVFTFYDVGLSQVNIWLLYGICLTLIRQKKSLYIIKKEIMKNEE